MTVLDDVDQLIKRLSPHAICDDCIAEKLNLTVRQHANHKTRQLAEQNNFMREKGNCYNCGKTKKVIKAKHQ